jgi:hypothetical protein
MLANWPWTLLVIRPVKAILIATEPAQADAQTRALIAKWGKLHAVRTALGFSAMLIFLWTCVSH